MRIAFRLLALTLLLAGCVSNEPARPLTHAERCTRAFRLLGAPIDPFQKAALYERMQNEGCLGRPQPAAAPAPSTTAVDQQTWREACALLREHQRLDPDQTIEAQAKMSELGCPR